MVWLFSAHSSNRFNNYGIDEPTVEGVSAITVKPEKVKMLWFDAEANFYLFSQKTNVTKYLDLAQKSGFNTVVVNVRPVQGDVLYNSNFIPALTSLHGLTVNRDWDYLGYFVQEAHKTKSEDYCRCDPLLLPDYYSRKKEWLFVQRIGTIKSAFSILQMES